MCKFRNRTEVADGVGRSIYYADEIAAQSLLDQGRAEVEAEANGYVVKIRLVEGQTPSSGSLGLWPGSYGIHREPTARGTRIFQHKKNIWEREAVAA